jgi:hypothetical protein
MFKIFSVHHVHIGLCAGTLAVGALRLAVDRHTSTSSFVPFVTYTHCDKSNVATTSAERSVAHDPTDNGLIAVYLSAESREQMKRYLESKGRSNVEPR